MNQLNLLNACTEAHVARFYLCNRARVTHAPTGRVVGQNRERENEKVEKQGHVARFNWLSGFLSS